MPIAIAHCVLETQALHLLQILMRLESQDRPQHHRYGRGHGANTPCQVGYPLAFFAF